MFEPLPKGAGVDSCAGHPVELTLPRRDPVSLEGSHSRGARDGFLPTNHRG